MSTTFIRRKRGHLGLAVQFDLFNTTAKISVAAQVTNDGTHYDAVSASGSLLAPIPVAGPDFRLYLTKSPRLFVSANVLGMYLFGYGNFVPRPATLESLFLSISPSPGYQLGSHLVVNNTQDRIGLRLVQKGAVVGASDLFLRRSLRTISFWLSDRHSRSGGLGGACRSFGSLKVDPCTRRMQRRA